MLFTEPIVAWFAIYDGLNYAYVRCWLLVTSVLNLDLAYRIIYLAIEAVPIVYAEHGIQEPVSDPDIQSPLD